MTTETTGLLGLPTGDAVAGIVVLHLEAATGALARMKDRRDAEALHDFRVAVRRLRSVLRAYGPWLGSAAGRRVQRALKDVGDRTNAGRDAEVQVAWIESRREVLSRGERTGLNWILRRLRSVTRSAYAKARRTGRDDFARIAARIRERLGPDPSTSPRLREVFPLLLREHAAQLERHLAAVAEASDGDAIHSARIRAKRLRYLLEPLRGELVVVKELLRSLRALQDVLGDLHDMHVLDAELAAALDDAATQKAHRMRELALAGESAQLRREHRRDERLGLVALAALVQAHRRALFCELEAARLAETTANFTLEIRRLADSLDPPAIPVERERKFLLRELPAKAREGRRREIEQGWLPGLTLHERLRRVADADGERFYRTVKLGRGVERIEIEEEAGAELFATMWPLTEGCRISKRRYCVDEGTLTWEIDEFLDRDLVMAEVELDAVDQAVPIPAWLEAVMVREVTDDPAYLNLSLARNPAVPLGEGLDEGA